MMSGKGYGEKEDGDEGRGGDGPIVRLVQSAPRDADERLDDDHENGGLDAEKGRLDDRHLSEQGVGDAEPEHDQGARQHEEQAGGEAARRTVQPPADIGGKLHGLRARQQHAEIERMQKALLADPAALLDENAMHERDLSGRSAEGHDADLGPDVKRFTEGRFGCRSSE